MTNVFNVVSAALRTVVAPANPGRRARREHGALPGWPFRIAVWYLESSRSRNLSRALQCHDIVLVDLELCFTINTEGQPTSREDNLQTYCGTSHGGSTLEARCYRK